MASACIIRIGGYSGSGKTTLIERALPELKKKGLCVGVLKHTSGHKLSPDTEGKDTERFFRAGADFVFGHDESQAFARYPVGGEGLVDALRRFPPGLDLVLVEGHRDASVPTIWIVAEKAEFDSFPGEVLFRGDPLYIEKFLDFALRELASFSSGRTLRAGLLIGGKSSRMERPKAMLTIRGETLMERSFDTLSSVSSGVVLLGQALIPGRLEEAPYLADVPGVDGPMAGMLSAFRWDPSSAWLISAVDMPFMEKAAWEWLISQRRPGIWAVLPRLAGKQGIESTGALYEPTIFEHIESLARRGVFSVQKLAFHPKVITPLVPEHLAVAWKNVNTPEEWNKVVSSLGSGPNRS